MFLLSLLYMGFLRHLYSTSYIINSTQNFLFILVSFTSLWVCLPFVYVYRLPPGILFQDLPQPNPTTPYLFLTHRLTPFSWTILITWFSLSRLSSCLFYLSSYEYTIQWVWPHSLLPLDLSFYFVEVIKSTLFYPRTRFRQYRFILLSIETLYKVSFLVVLTHWSNYTRNSLSFFIFQ